MVLFLHLKIHTTFLLLNILLKVIMGVILCMIVVDTYQHLEEDMICPQVITVMRIPLILLISPIHTAIQLVLQEFGQSTFTGNSNWRAKEVEVFIDCN